MRGVARLPDIERPLDVLRDGPDEQCGGLQGVRVEVLLLVGRHLGDHLCNVTSPKE